MIEIDDRDMGGGEKIWQHIKQGMPIRLEIGPRDIAQNNVFVGRRDKPSKEKQSISRETFINQICAILDEIQDNLYHRASSFLQSHIVEINSLEQFKQHFAGEEAPGFARVFCSPQADYAALTKSLKITARCIPLEGRDSKTGQCIFSGETTSQQVLFAKAY
jgi:prolyl-tRNA synthetase